MALPEHREEAADRPKEGSARVDDAGAKPLAPMSAREWMEGLTAYAVALGDGSRASDESAHEKPNELAWTIGRGAV